MTMKLLGTLILGLALPFATGGCLAGSLPSELVAELAPPDPHAGHVVLAPDPHAGHVVLATGPLGSEASVPAAFAAIGALTINVTVNEKGFSPSTIWVPTGAKVRLVLRNRGLREHHFHIAGLNPTEMLWLVKDMETGAPVISTGPDDHSAHHGIEMATYHLCTARGGICPTGLDVHAHAGPGDVDVIMFTTAEKGTFQVSCPLHPELQGKVVIF